MSFAPSVKTLQLSRYGWNADCAKDVPHVLTVDPHAFADRSIKVELSRLLVDDVPILNTVSSQYSDRKFNVNVCKLFAILIPSDTLNVIVPDDVVAGFDGVIVNTLLA